MISKTKAVLAVLFAAIFGVIYGVGLTYVLNGVVNGQFTALVFIITLLFVIASWAVIGNRGNPTLAFMNVIAMTAALLAAITSNGSEVSDLTNAQAQQVAYGICFFTVAIQAMATIYYSLGLDAHDEAQKTTSKATAKASAKA